MASDCAKAEGKARKAEVNRRLATPRGLSATRSLSAKVFVTGFGLCPRPKDFASCQGGDLRNSLLLSTRIIYWRHSLSHFGFFLLI